MKRVILTMVNEELFGGRNAEIGFKLEDIIRQSFIWWHSQLKEQDSIRLDRWRIESIEVKEMSSAGG